MCMNRGIYNRINYNVLIYSNIHNHFCPQNKAFPLSIMQLENTN